ncbi:hypothetical protein JZ751_016213 [Albula glossodonta]|uniref:Sema domain-containing protein n=1 Tax=Albula glossodonta TaxID=121402 RepID=A0A8T2MWR0_9TELE|nr:hypothetical protein JZ751_016213 [Albula glossodonta]
MRHSQQRITWGTSERGDDRYSALPDQELFSGMYIDFMGTDAAIFRSLTRRNAVRTDQHNSKWLSGETLSICDSSLFSGGSRNDIGGQRSLVNKWTTFLKARMVCVVQEQDGTETHFDELESVFLLESEHPKRLLVFAVFTSTR